ncbi:MAG TPA: hypothetical protein VGO43_07345 [Pyrinomonadaceae bacterium]|jgi:hypothetical protein|nr:hypothetical protein [Pyrinomonadaceae bacterium]
MKYSSILLVAILLLALVLGCKWGFGGNTETANNSNNTNRSSSNRDDDDDLASSSPTPDANRDITPQTLSVSDMVEGSGDEDKVGRMTTVSGGVLEKLESDSLLIRAPYGGAAFYCYGDFDEYMSTSERVRSLAASGRSPKVTVKGVYKIASVGTGGELNPCVLSDIEKP